MTTQQHTSHAVVTAAQAAGFKTVNHSPYSSDIAPSGFYLYTKLKTHLRGQACFSDEEVIQCVDAFFEVQDPEFHRTGIAAI